jgi:hypothetical protein
MGASSKQQQKKRKKVEISLEFPDLVPMVIARAERGVRSPTFAGFQDVQGMNSQDEMNPSLTLECDGTGRVHRSKIVQRRMGGDVVLTLLTVGLRALCVSTGRNS